jgi:predicted DNA-binding protein
LYSLHKDLHWKGGDEVMAKREATLNVRLPVELKAEIDAAAKQAGLTITEFLQQALELRIDMPQEFFNQIEKAAAVLRLTPATVIINKLIKSVCFEQAWFEVFGGYPPSANLEFRFDEKGLVTGDELGWQLFGEFKAQLQEAKAKLEDTSGVRPFLSYGEAEAILKGVKPTKQ